MSELIKEIKNRRACIARLLFILFIALPLSAAPTWRERAAQGDIEAIRKVGDVYFYGTKKISRNLTLAAYWYRKGAEKGDAACMFNYGICLDRGLGIEQDRFKALEWYKKAGEKGMKPARFNVAIMTMRGIPADEKRNIPAIQPSPELGLLYLERLANEDFLQAELLLAEICLEQKNNQKLQEKGVALLKKICSRETPPPQALRMLADCKFSAIGMERDLDGMIRLLEQADAAGDAEASGKLGYCYEYGRGVAIDEKKAFALYKRGADRGNGMSAFKYAEFLLYGRCTGGTPDIPNAIHYYQQSSDSGNVRGMTKLGILTMHGVGMEKNESKAVKLFFEAAKRGFPEAQYHLSKCFETGKGGAIKDDAAAVYWMQRAASAGNGAAAREIANRYFKGQGVPRSITQGEKWLDMAIKLGDIEAMRLKAIRNRAVY